MCARQHVLRARRGATLVQCACMQAGEHWQHLDWRVKFCTSLHHPPSVTASSIHINIRSRIGRYLPQPHLQGLFVAKGRLCCALRFERRAGLRGELG